jgi:pyruvate/2-oxoglutarate dehydrogenase complex dihydrolipoamide acyltransferase (E2) component
MDVPVVMPPLGDGAGDLVLNHWFKALGDQVIKGEPFFEVGTDKVDVAVEVLDSGRVSQILLAEGASAEEGQTIAYIDPSMG